MEIEDSMCRSIQRVVLETMAKTKESCDLETKKLCMFAGTPQEDEQALRFAEEETLNLKSVQINAEIVRSQGEMKTEESSEKIHQNVEAEDEGPSDDWSRTSRGIRGCVRFPKPTPIGVVELYRRLDFQRRKLEEQRTYAQNELLKKQGRGIVMDDNQRPKDGREFMKQMLEGKRD